MLAVVLPGGSFVAGGRYPGVGRHGGRTARQPEATFHEKPPESIMSDLIVFVAVHPRSVWLTLDVVLISIVEQCVTAEPNARRHCR
jgi:hypothetical protein